MTNDNKLHLPHSSSCFICGEANEFGLKCRFFTDAKGRVFLHSTIKSKYAGFTDVIHGGIQTAILDEAMGWNGFTQTDAETLFFTRDIQLKFRKNALTMTPIVLETDLVDVKRGLVYTTGKIMDDAGTVLTTASGVFAPIPKEKMVETANGLYIINDGRKYFEKAIRICNPKVSQCGQ